MEYTRVKEKRVSIHSQVPLSCLPIRTHGSILNQVFPVETILNCINANAIVFEVLDNGDNIQLGRHNYDIDLVLHPEMRAPKEGADRDVSAVKHPILSAVMKQPEEEKNPFVKTQVDELKEKIEKSENNAISEQSNENTQGASENSEISKISEGDEGEMAHREDGIQVINEQGLVLNESEMKKADEEIKKEQAEQHKKKGMRVNK